MSTDGHSENGGEISELQPRISPKYGDDTADVRLVSSDGVTFYVESYHLRASCKFFRALYKNSSLQNDGEPLLVDAVAKTLTVFLDIITADEDEPIDVDSKTGIELVGLYKFFDSPKLRVRLIAALKDRTDMPFWDAIRLSIDLDYPNFVVPAIEQEPHPVFSVERLATIDTTYAIALFNTYMYGRQHYTRRKGSGGVWEYCQWQTAQKFKDFLNQAKNPMPEEPKKANLVWQSVWGGD